MFNIILGLGGAIALVAGAVKNDATLLMVGAGFVVAALAIQEAKEDAISALRPTDTTPPRRHHGVRAGLPIDSTRYWFDANDTTTPEMLPGTAVDDDGGRWKLRLGFFGRAD